MAQRATGGAAAQLLALAECSTDRALAEAVRAFVRGRSDKAKAAGRASALVRASALAATTANALRAARSTREAEPGLSQEAVAKLIKAQLGGAVYDVPTLRKWVAGWERSGALTRRAEPEKNLRRNSVASQTGAAEVVRVAPKQGDDTWPDPPPREPQSPRKRLRSSLTWPGR